MIGPRQTERATGGSDRAVSSQVSYVLTIAIVAALLSTVTFVMSDVVTDQRENATQAELTVVGERLAAQLVAADDLALRGTPGTLRISTNLPDRVAGAGYVVELRTSEIELRTTDPDVTVTIPHKTTTPIAGTTVTGNPTVTIVLDSGDLTLSEEGVRP
ncbi:DUF7266 family protein [Salinirubrum litoreum]|uniref:Uncharacterized protein n=1 Tax=Salinirubrum litoreum TaxID=1126234 RepID=A0ABD5RDZ9_9EURY|nr:hypothetical protein [Salinirubrum litoreum]